MRLRLPHKAVYWAPVAAGTYGRPTHLAPVGVLCRWEDVTTESIQADNVDVASSATVYLASDVVVGGYLWKGSIDDVDGLPSDPKENQDVHEIINVDIVPAIRGSKQLVRAQLK